MPVFGVSAGHYVHTADGYLSELVDLVDVVDVFLIQPITIPVQRVTGGALMSVSD